MIAAAPLLYSRAPLSGWATEVARNGSGRPPAVVISTACSGSDAILMGAELIRSGAAKCCVCGGADVLTPNKRLAHSALGTMSPRICAPSISATMEPCWARARDFSFSSRRRRANQLCDSERRGLGQRRQRHDRGRHYRIVRGLCDERSLADADLPASAIGLINAHGSGTVMNDTTESNAFTAMFTGSSRPLVFATKGILGIRWARPEPLRLSP